VVVTATETLAGGDAATPGGPYPGDGIRTRSSPGCYLCGAAGASLYENLTDRLFGAPGVWNFRQCPNASCGLIWLDPAPIESDIRTAYRHYYTHAPQAHGSRRATIEQAKRALILAYDCAWRLTPMYARRREMELMCLGELPPGRVLEVGCGSGKQLATLAARGWDVQGLDVDEEAAAQARKAYGIPVFCGPLHEAGFRDEEFDAVVTSHVIEHVYDPIGLLRESRRVLKQGGRLVVITPNANGWGHARFGRSWRGLEPPRHLFLFSRKTLEHVARACGFCDVKTSTTAARSEWTVGQSLRVEQGESVRKLGPLVTRAVRQALLHAQALVAERLDPDAGDECILRARR